LRKESNAMPAYPQDLVEKIRALPEKSRAEVESFVDFVATREHRLAALDRVLAIAPALEAAGAPPLDEADIAAEVKETRVARRAHADRP
jgi:hypothetical protein